MTHPFVDKDTSAFVDDPNFKKFVELFFGVGTKTTYRREWVDNYGDEPVQKILLIHVPGMPAIEANERLVKFYELMLEMKDYPINLIIDVINTSQEDYIKNQTEMEVGKV